MSNREEFEKQMKGTFGMLVDLRAREGTGFSYMDWGTQVAWVMWQARVPEGYVVVPVKCTNNMAHAAKEVDGRLSAFKYSDVWKAMIEAAEK